METLRGQKINHVSRRHRKGKKGEKIAQTAAKKLRNLYQLELTFVQVVDT